MQCNCASVSTVLSCMSCVCLVCLFLFLKLSFETYADICVASDFTHCVIHLFVSLALRSMRYASIGNSILHCGPALRSVNLPCYNHAITFYGMTAMILPPGTYVFPLWLSVLCMRSKAWLAARVSLRLARLPCTASSGQRSRCLCSTRLAAPSLLAHAEVTKNIMFFNGSKP